MREFTVRDWCGADLLPTGDVQAVGLRPQRLSAAEPYCLKCEASAWPVASKGRWDADRGATAIPYEPVFVEMSCGCTFGEERASTPAETTGGAR